MTRRRGKLNKSLAHLFKPEKIRDLIKLEETSRDDLLKIAKNLKIDGIEIDWAENYHKYSPSIPLILNIGDNGIGTHWVACYNDRYFDPFGLAPDLGLEHLQWTPITIQDMRKGWCGQYALLWLYYAIHDKLDQFYSMFKEA